jgi:methyltransferase
MGLSTWLYLLLVASVAGIRLVELSVSRRHQRALSIRGVTAVQEHNFRWMVLVHAGVILCSPLEVIILRRPLIPLLAITSGVLLLLATALRWWVIRSLAAHWNVQVMDSLELGVVTTGPYRWLRHPNYLAVFVELEALPLLHTAWLTAFVGGLAHAWVLRHRIEAEELVLMRSTEYRASMGPKPRLVPRIGRP